MIANNLKSHALALLLAALMTFLTGVTCKEFLGSLELRADDYVWQFLAAESFDSEQRLVIIDIDDASIASQGAWPWSREIMAKLTERLTQEGVALQIYDVVFPVSKLNDDLLASELKKTSSVMAQILAIKSDELVNLGALQGGVLLPNCSDFFDSARAVIANNVTLVGSSAGHITPRISADGRIRKLPAMICSGDKAYVALALAAIAEGAAVKPEFRYSLTSDLFAPHVRLEHDNIPGLSVPIDEQGDILLPWWLSRTALTAVSAKDVLSGSLPKDFLLNAWVLIGATTFGASDAVSTPQGGVVSGVEVHAQLISAFMDGRIPYRPIGANWGQSFWVLLVAMVLWLSARCLNRFFVLGLSVVGGLIIVLTLFLHVWLLQGFSVVLPWVLSVEFVVLGVSLIVLQQYHRGRLERKLLFSNLSSYLPEHVALKIAGGLPTGELHAYHETVVVLYADLRNFSSWCDQLPANDVGLVLHRFYSLSNQVITEYDGILEEYVGDAVLAVWRGDSIGSKPLKAAQQLVQLGGELFGDKTYIDSLPPLAVGVGVDQGEVLVGSFGSRARRVHTLLGKTVTMAMRYQSMTEELAYPVIFGKNVLQLLDDNFQGQSLGSFMLAGNHEPTELFVFRMDSMEKGE